MTQRVLGSVAASTEGATVVGIGGLHGNEPAGVRALESVLRDLRREGRGLNRGEFVALSGNRPALRAGVRFLDRDLNRIWTETPPVDDIEGREQADLSKILYAIREEDSGPIHLVDLHSASGDAPPFAVLGDTPANREFGLALPVPLVLGLPNEIHGTLLEYLDGRGWASVGFESGSHRGADSMSMAASALWLLLGSSNCWDRATHVCATLALSSRRPPRAFPGPSRSSTITPWFQMLTSACFPGSVPSSPCARGSSWRGREARRSGRQGRDGSSCLYINQGGERVSS